MNEIFNITDQKQLFIDDRWFSTQQGMTLKVNPPIKAERVISAEKHWESLMLCPYNTVMEHDGVYKMWYDAIGAIDDQTHERCVCYAISTDGIHWERQNVNLIEWEGIKENNILMAGVNGSVMLDPKAPEEERFKGLFIVKENEAWDQSKGAICGCYDGETRLEEVPGAKGTYFMELYLCTSPDGIHWKRQRTCALPFFHDSQNVFFYDTRLNKYTAYVRWHGNKGRSVARVEFDNPMNLPWPYQDNPAAVRGPGRSIQRVGDEMSVVLSKDELDGPGADLYTPCVQQYPWAADTYLSFTTLYRNYPVGDILDTTAHGKNEQGTFLNDGPVEVQLAVSRDGITWTRPDRRPYVPLGLKGSWDGGQTYMSLGMIRKGDEIWQYYSGTVHTHGAYNADTRYAGGICRLVQRLDGFVSADADYTGAEFTTPLITFTGKQLQLNVDCSAMGSVRVELLDEQNKVIPGYRLNESISVDRNQTAAPVAWKERDNVNELIGRPVRLHFKLRACKLYAFQFVSS